MSEAEKLADEMQETAKACRVLGLPEVKDWCSTGCTVLDLAISNTFPGGIPIGRIVQVYGGASTAKSVLATTILGYALRSGKHAFYADVEHTLDPAFAAYYGLDCTHENFYYGYGWSDPKKVQEQPGTLEEFFDTYLGGILKLRTRKPKVIVVDSITALPAAFEISTEMTKQGFGAYRAKQISLGLRKYISLLAEKDVTLFVIDQTRDNVGAVYASEVTTGGRGMEFYSSVRLHLTHGCKVVNSKEKEIGVWVNFKIDKNKVAPPFRKGKFKILFDYGMDDIVSNLSYLALVSSGASPSYRLTATVTLDVCKACGSLLVPGTEKCSCGGEVEQVDKQIQHWLALIEEQKREKELQAIVAEVWKNEYRAPNRKAREW